MSSTAAQKVASAIRPGLRQPGQPASPHTPQRTISSAFSSPGSSFRHEEDSIIFELGSRYLRAGFEGESAPQCVMTFSPRDSRRIGDFRDWLPSDGPRTLEQKGEKEWYESYELWHMDMDDMDLDLFEDKLERAVRDAYNKHLLVDAGTAKLVMVLPSVIPHPLLSSVLSTLFNRWKYTNITLLPSPIMATIAAGLRSALVVDIGWSETVVTGVYEYREVKSQRSTRAMRLLTLEMGRLLSDLREDASSSREKDANTIDEADSPPPLTVGFDFAEEVTTRLAWCPNISSSVTTAQNSNTGGLAALSIADDTPARSSATSSDATVSIPWPPEAPLQSKTLPFSTFSRPVERSLLADDVPSGQLDDEELGLPVLIFRTLLSMSPDVRGLCMSRLVFAGGGSHIPGLKERVITEVGALVDQHGWSAVRGKAVDKRHNKLKEQRKTKFATEGPIAIDRNTGSRDYVIEELNWNQGKTEKPPVRGTLREVGSLGPWAGASLVASLKIKSFVDVERDKFLQHGLAGANRDVESSVVPQRLSLGPSLNKAANDRSGWTLGSWA